MLDDKKKGQTKCKINSHEMMIEEMRRTGERYINVFSLSTDGGSLQRTESESGYSNYRTRVIEGRGLPMLTTNAACRKEEKPEFGSADTQYTPQ